MKVFVNIYNKKGKFLGINLPVYNFPLDASVVSLLKEMNFDIKVVDPKRKKINDKIVNNVKTNTEAESISTSENINADTDSQKAEAWQTKDVYTEEELKKFTKIELKKILNYRGHYSRRIGERDRLAPKADDNRTVLIQKILETNRQ